MNIMFFIVTSNTLDNNHDIEGLLTLWTYTIGAHTKLVSKYIIFSPSQSQSVPRKTRSESALGK